MAHETKIVKGSTGRSKTGGVSWKVSCCGQHEASGHIQNPGKHTLDELKRLQQDHMAEVAEEHESHIRAIDFLQGVETEEDCGCK